MITHFFSDPHFGHKNILKHCPWRPYNNITEMRDEFIENYNRFLTEDSVVCWVGDAFFLSIDESKAIMDKLLGHKVLCVGNHDKSKSAMLAMGFEYVTDSFHMMIAGKVCHVIHYPPKGAKHAGYEFDERFNDKRPERKKGEYIIHGHTHSMTRKDGNAIHVGVDAWDYHPVSIDVITDLIKKDWK